MHSRPSVKHVLGVLKWFYMLSEKILFQKSSMVFSLTSLTPRPPVWQKTITNTGFFFRHPFLRKEQRVASCHWQLKLKWKCEAIKALTKLIAKQKRTKCKSQRRRNPIKFLWEVSIFIFRYIEYTVLHWDIDKWHLRWIFLYLMKASKFDECDWFRDSCNSVDIDESFTLTLQGDMVVFNFTM